MAKTPEGKVKDHVKQMLTGLNAYFVMPQTGGFGSSGVPDILCCLNGRFIGIECKANGGKVTRLQQSNLDSIEAAGGVSFVADEHSLVILKSLLTEIAK